MPLRKQSTQELKKNRERQAAPSQVLDHLRKLIEKNHMQPGDRLPSERALALKFHVGRPAIREAIKALQTLDVLDSRHGDGTFVKSLAGLSGGWPAKVELGTRNINLIELLEVRKMIEPSAAALAAARCNEKQFGAMEREVAAQEKRPGDSQNLIRHDYLFHEAILQAAGNSVLLELIKVLSPFLQRSYKQTAMSTNDLGIARHQHRTILEAIRRRDPEMAEQAMRSHLQTTGMDLIADARPRRRG